jgi:bile acid:Na+ symporter, BASS family
MIFKIISHRNFLLISALILGLVLGDNLWVLPQASVYILAVVMSFASVDVSFSVFRNAGQSLRSLMMTFFLNYIVLGGSLIFLAYVFFPGSEIIAGCILLAASPPGPSVVPFTSLMKGDVTRAVTGLSGLHLIAVVLAPVILTLFAMETAVEPKIIIVLMLKTIVIPLIISRILRHKLLLHKVKSIKGKVINWGFFLIILPIVGLSRQVMFENLNLIWESMLLFAVVMVAWPVIFHWISFQTHTRRETVIADTFFLTTKSSAFAAVVVFATGQTAAGIPAAVHAFFVTIVFLVYSSLYKD